MTPRTRSILFAALGLVVLATVFIGIRGTRHGDVITAAGANETSTTPVSAVTTTATSAAPTTTSTTAAPTTAELLANATPEQLAAFQAFVGPPPTTAPPITLPPPPITAPVAPRPRPTAPPPTAPPATDPPPEPPATEPPPPPSDTGPGAPPGIIEGQTSPLDTLSPDDAAFLSCVRWRESRDDYTAVNGRSGAGGAYQFLQSTWNNTASHAGRGDLIGVRPNEASPIDQDAIAVHLLGWYGRSPWGGRCG